MAKTTKNVPGKAQKPQDEVAVGTDIPEVETASDAAVSGQIIGPESEAELLGCQDEAELAESLLTEYAVTSENGLRLRQEPSLEATILAVLPWGVGVLGDEEPAPDGWLYVRTGRLEGWMLARYLERLPMPELTDRADG